MPSSLIIVALAAAWLVVLVPMVARSRQEVARPADSALSARVVRSGNARHEQRREEFAMSGNESDGRNVHSDIGRVDEEDFDNREAWEEFSDADGEFEDLTGADGVEPEDARSAGSAADGERQTRKYRPGRGGFDPEAAEVAARAKYAYRQRVVVGLLLTAVATAILAAVLLPVVWWAHGITDAVLVGYLAYLRRQVRIENEIRERRLARLNRAAAGYARESGEFPDPAESSWDEAGDEADEPYESADAEPVERPAARTPRRPRRPVQEPIQHNGVYVDLDDEDPAFYELDEPGEQPFRRASGQ